MNGMILSEISNENRFVAESEVTARNKIVEFKEFKIKDIDDANLVSREVNFFKDRLKEIEAKRKETKKPIREAGERIDALFDGAKKAAMSAIALFSGMLEDYEMAERKKRKAKRIADELERKKAEAEANRIIEEGRRKAETLAKQAAEARSDKEAEKLLAKAVAQAEKANAKAEMALLSAQAIEEMPETSKIEGSHFREDWYYEIIDIDKLDRKYMIPDDAMLSGLAKGTKGKLAIDGIRFYSNLVTVKGRKA